VQAQCEKRSLSAAATCEDAQEGNQVAVVGEEGIIVEVDVVAGAGGAWASRENAEKVNKVSVIRKEAVAVEVDSVALRDGLQEAGQVCAARGDGNIRSSKERRWQAL
jgi:glycine/D-amino acid oxidase-like deaminating enzyme